MSANYNLTIGVNPLAYQGVNAASPPNLTVTNTSPTPKNAFNFNEGDLWLNQATQQLYALMKLIGSGTSRTANWQLLGNATGAVTQLSGNTGIALPVAGNINVLVRPIEGTSRFAASADNDFLSFTDVSNNIGIGTLSLGSAPSPITTGTFNVALGVASLVALTSGFGNVAIGAVSAPSLTTGANNVMIGNSASAVVSGIRNIVIGYFSGNFSGPSDSSNIYLSNSGTIESNTIRIGTQGSGIGQQNTAFMAGIIGNTVSNAEVVTINSSTGQLGTGGGSIVTSWVEVLVAGPTAMSIGTGYIANVSSPTVCVLTMPSIAPQGSIIRVTGKGTGQWQIALNAGQIIHMVASSTSVGGTLTSTNGEQWDSVELVCITANTEFNALDNNGNFVPA